MIANQPTKPAASESFLSFARRLRPDCRALLAEYADTAAIMGEPEMRKALTKVAFAKEWAKSLRDSHPDSDARAQALVNFEEERRLLLQVLGKVLPEFSLIQGNMPVYRQSKTWL